MTDIAIKNQLEALRNTTKKALESKEASLQLLSKLGLSSSPTSRQPLGTTVKTSSKIRTS